MTHGAHPQRQGFAEAHIDDIESKLTNTQVIDPKQFETVGPCVFGALVDLHGPAGAQPRRTRVRHSLT